MKNSVNIQLIIITTIALSALCISSLCSPVVAGTFSISLSMTTHYTPGHLSVTATVSNNGSTTAHDAIIELQTPGAAPSHTIETDILSGNTSEFLFEIPIGPLKPGDYPVVAVCRFKDFQEYPFTAIHAATFIVEKQCADLISADLRELSIKKKAPATLVLQNTYTAALPVKIQVVLPDEFSQIKEHRMTLQPHSSDLLQFDITNLHALAGAAYPFFSIIEYDTNKCHQTLIAKKNIRVAQISNENLFYPVRWYLLSGFTIFLSGIILAGVIRNKIAKKK